MPIIGQPELEEAALLRTSDLASRSDYDLADVKVSPSRRLVAGPGGQRSLEPRVMQVMTCLADAVGAVVTRDDLYEACWGGAQVGEDSMNRAVAKLRKSLDEVAPGSLEIETIPRTGYRLYIKAEPIGPARDSVHMNRRTMLGAGSAVLVAAIAGGAYFWTRDAETQVFDREVTQWIDEADKLLREWLPGNDTYAEALLLKAVQRQPENARAWGLLALTYRRHVETGDVQDIPQNLAAGTAAADRALRLDPDESHALVAKATLQPEFGNWGAVEEALARILSVAPDNVHALSYMTMLLQEVGRATDSWNMNERVLALDPMSPTAQYRRALKHWIFGRDNDAYLTINRAIQTWPNHLLLWFGRFYIYMFTGRGADVVRMLDDKPSIPAGLQPEWRTFFRLLATAVSTRSREDMIAARDLMLNTSPSANAYSIVSIMGLSYLGLVDDAFDVADARFLHRGPLAGAMWANESAPDVADHHWTRTMNLFTPATRNMRLDTRFDRLTAEIGMKRYWNEKGIKPDPFLMR